MSDWRDIFRAIADRSEDFLFDRGMATFQWHGEEHVVTVENVEAIGPAVTSHHSPAGQKTHDMMVPVSVFVQRDLLRLHVLAQQMRRVIEEQWRERPTPFVDGPGEFEGEPWDGVALKLNEALKQQVAGATRIILLSAPAGQGKTALIEEVSLKAGNAYQPATYPRPLLLPVDLLGRYIGTIDDAIAGTLSKTFIVPLSQRDVIAALRFRWIMLALDGFDELVARVGTRDAFQRVTELVDSLDGEGTVILSARNEFFDDDRVRAGMRSFLNPKIGSYVTEGLKLSPWGKKEAERVFKQLDTSQPELDAAALLESFAGSVDFVYRPFFLTRLAQLWATGSRFTGAQEMRSEEMRIEYLIAELLRREATEKWVDQKKNPLLQTGEHYSMLEVIAEEIQRSSVSNLTRAELDIAVELALVNCTPEVVAESKSKIATHALVRSLRRDNRFVLLHEKVHSFFLGRRIAAHLQARSSQHTMADILRSRDFGAETADWAAWTLRDATTPEAKSALSFLAVIATETGTDPTVAANTGHLIAALLRTHSDVGDLQIVRAAFFGDVLRGLTLSRLRFEDCAISNIDISGTSFLECSFHRCALSNVQINSGTTFDGSTMQDCEFHVFVDRATDRTTYAPVEIRIILQRLGAEVLPPVPDTAGTPATRTTPRVSQHAIQCVERLVQLTTRRTDIAIKDVDHEFPDVASQVFKAALGTILKESLRETSGARKRLVRFAVLRDSVLKGLESYDASVVSPVTSFWKALAETCPAEDERADE